MASFGNVRCGEVPSLHALAVSPDVLGSHTIPPNATLVRYITVPPTGPDIYVNEIASAPDVQFMFSFRRPKAELGSLAMDLRDTPGGYAAMGRFSNACMSSTSLEHLVRMARGITMLEELPEMEAWITHVQT
ncbi:hypothetical protein MKX07_002797 [Trichoderma sp. CBMAI-0711]|nr:hypothetical protein MKX07_002797 [Trichoderma sp. CBMAI-0711]